MPFLIVIFLHFHSEKRRIEEAKSIGQCNVLAGTIEDTIKISIFIFCQFNGVGN